MFSRCLPWILLVLIALPEARAEEPARERVGTLRIVSKYWADVYVDGKRKGAVPLPLLSLPVGSHVVSLLGNPALGQYRREVIIRAGEVTELHVDPESPPDALPVEPDGTGSPRSRAASAGRSREVGQGRLQLVTKHWANVYVDDEFKGRAPLAPISLPAGRHVIVLRGNPSVAPHRQEVVIRAGETTELYVESKLVE